MDKLADYKYMIDFLTEAYAHLQSLRADDIKEGKNINVFSLWNSFSGITEPIHSKILQFLLSPHNMHGQGNLFINLLLKRINVDFKENEERRKELNLAMARLELGLVRGFSKLKGAENV